METGSHEGQQGTDKKTIPCSQAKWCPHAQGELICFMWLSTSSSKGFSGTNIYPIQEVNLLAFFYNGTIIITKIMTQLYMLTTFTYLLNTPHGMEVYKHISWDNDYYNKDIENILKCFLKESKRPLLYTGCHRKLTSNSSGYFMWVEVTCFT